MEIPDEVRRPRLRSQSIEKVPEPESEVVDLEDIEFIPPAAGTPAAEALAANAAIEVTKYDKVVGRRVKRPKFKNVTRNHKVRQTRKIKGKVIDGVHELYTLTIGMMLGIRVAIGRQHQFETHDLTVEDFMHVDKYEFPPDGNTKPPNRTPPHSLAHTFKFKNYAPKVFRRIRGLFGIDSANYMMSVCGNYNYLEFISNSKSGQFFFYSHDGRYMIKTQTPEENKFLRRILPHYYKYIVENPNTLLVRFYGMHRVKMYHLRRKVHFVIMGSVFDTTETIHSVYDLKGSAIGRRISQEDRARGAVRKDLDLIDDGVQLQFGTKKQAFVEQLAKDAEFLAQLNIMDYSLLVGIHDRQLGGAHQAMRSNTPFRRHHDNVEPIDGMSSARESNVSIDHGHPNTFNSSSFEAHDSFDMVDGHNVTVRAHRGKSYDMGSLQPLPDDEVKIGFDDHSEFSSRVEQEEDSNCDEYEEESEPASPSHAKRHNSSASLTNGVNTTEGTKPSSFGAYRTESEFISTVREPRDCPWSSRQDGGIVGRLTDGNPSSEIYYVGIIDILQQYNVTKKAEHLFKSFRHDKHQISAVDAGEYASRFVNFVSDQLV